MLQIRSCSARRYRVLGRLPSIREEAFHQRLSDRKFLPLTPSEERSFGWVEADNCLKTGFGVDAVVRGDTAVLGLRIDRRRVNPRLFRAHVELEVEARRKGAEDGGGPARLSRDERLEVRAEVHERLLRQTSPTTAVVSVVLAPRRRMLYMLGLSRFANEILVRLVRDTFAVELVALTPWQRGREILAGGPGAERLDGLERSAFAAQTSAAVMEVPS